MSERAEDLLDKLPARHQDALRWFLRNRGTVQPWPSPILGPDGESSLLASRPKGIYKPHWSPYALSVRQSLNSPYPDKEPIYRADGSWFFAYFQEKTDPDVRDAEFTNRAMLACRDDRVPVGVMRQVRPKPGTRYQILGLATVAGWEAGFFFLEGFGDTGFARGRGPAGELEWIAQRAAERGLVSPAGFDPTGIVDAREHVMAEIVRRRGQPRFRQPLLDAYGNHCAISNCGVTEVLEAAHIAPYLGAETNRTDNGLILRSDLHTLFDSGLIAIDTQMSIILSPTIVQSEYGVFAGVRLRAPLSSTDRPSIAALQAHREWSGL